MNRKVTASKAMLFVVGIGSDNIKAKLRRCVDALVDSERGMSLTERIMLLDKRQLKLLFQLNEYEMSRIPDDDLVAILRRYERGDESGRSAWRRLLRRYGISNRPLGVTKDQAAYKREWYLETAGKGKTLDRLVRVIDRLEELRKKHDDDQTPSARREMRAIIRELCEIAQVPARE
jgi:hypothetical protein